MKTGMISRINELELDRYCGFFSAASQDNLEHSKANRNTFPRWSIISAYYAMHDMTKLFLAKRYRIKIDYKVHMTTIHVLRHVLKDKKLLSLLEKGHEEFLAMANDLAEAKKERVKVQYYTGTPYLKELYRKRAEEFDRQVVMPFLAKMQRLIQ